MKLSEITVAVVEQYCRVDAGADTVILTAILAAAKQYCVSYTGLTETELDDYPDIPIAVFALCSDMYDNRQMTISSGQANPTVNQVLGSHCKNLL